MKYTQDEVMQFVQEDDVKFIRLAFCDVSGRQKNISILPGELQRAFERGIPFDGSALPGFGDEACSDLLLHPDPDTLMVLPWRPEHGKVVRMFSRVSLPDGRDFPGDTRSLLQGAVAESEKLGRSFYFGAEQEFYLFNLDDRGEPTLEPYDWAGYMDIAPEDRGENIRREICLTLEQMGIVPESSYHKEGPGQNEIDFRYSDPITAADNAMTFRTVVKTVARRNGLYADFSPKPLPDKPGNGLHINMSVRSEQSGDDICYMIAGVLDKVREMTAFLNPVESSYARFGQFKAPRYISWSGENRSQLVRIPSGSGQYRRAELRSPDPEANPYLAFALIIHAGLYGIRERLDLPMVADLNLYKAPPEILDQYGQLPGSLQEARKLALESAFIQAYLPGCILNSLR
ncbi:glutamine synthetase family protein [Acutalibacter muris]|jgi:glutamine synthetase|uniref:glutamine synthetase family protein n=1 Tax=Acutalibacter muris TaxID=1796620 RepID=UPI0026F3DB66|nr:glutamine synthetase family protein [Acutalibacter muris]